MVWIPVWAKAHRLLETLEAMTLDSEIQMTGAMACAGQGFDVATDLFGCLDPKKRKATWGGAVFLV